MKDYRQTLHRAGQILIVVGTIDVAVLVACILASQAYSSSVSVFAIAAGIYLKRGNLNTVLWVTRFGALILAACVLAYFIVLPRIEPPTLWLIQLRLRTLSTLPMLAGPLVILPPLAWTYGLLRRREVRAALKENGLATRPPVLWFAAGVAMAWLAAAGTQLFLHGDIAQKIIAQARAENGDQYQYVIRQMFVSPHDRNAVVTAFRQDEIKDITVTW